MSWRNSWAEVVYDTTQATPILPYTSRWPLTSRNLFPWRDNPSVQLPHLAICRHWKGCKSSSSSSSRIIWRDLDMTCHLHTTWRKFVIFHFSCGSLFVRLVFFSLNSTTTFSWLALWVNNEHKFDTSHSHSNLLRSMPAKIYDGRSQENYRLFAFRRKDDSEFNGNCLCRSGKGLKNDNLLIFGWIDELKKHRR